MHKTIGIETPLKIMQVFLIPNWFERKGVKNIGANAIKSPDPEFINPGLVSSVQPNPLSDESTATHKAIKILKPNCTKAIKKNIKTEYKKSLFLIKLDFSFLFEGSGGLFGRKKTTINNAVKIKKALYYDYWINWGKK